MALTFLQSTLNGDRTGGGSNLTWPGVSFGAEAPDRIIAHAMGFKNGSTPTCTIGGVTADVLFIGVGGSNHICLAWAVVPTGLAGDVVWNAGNSQATSESGGLYRLTGMSPTLYDQALLESSGDEWVYVDVAEGGDVIAGVFFTGNRTTSPWSGATEDHFEDPARTTSTASATGLSLEAQRGLKPNDANNQVATLAASFEPASGGSTPVTVEPGTGSAGVETFAPTVVAGQSATAEPGAGAAAIETYTPTVAAGAGATVEPQTGSIEVETYAPTVSLAAGAVVAPETGSAAIETFAPTVVAGSGAVVTPQTGEIAIETFAPTVGVEGPTVVAPGTGAIQIETYAPVVTAGQSVEVGPGVAVISIETYRPTVGEAVAPVGQISVDGVWHERTASGAWADRAAGGTWHDRTATAEWREVE